MQHAYPFEVLQLMFSTLGAVINLWAWLETIKDKQVLEISGLNGAKKVVARSNAQQEMLRFITQMILVLMGIVGVLNPPPPWPAELAEFIPIQRNVAFTRFCLTMISFLLVLKSVWIYRDRQTLMSMWMYKNSNRRRVNTPIDFPDRREH